MPFTFLPPHALIPTRATAMQPPHRRVSISGIPSLMGSTAGSTGVSYPDTEDGWLFR